MNQYRTVWRSILSIKNELKKINVSVWNGVRWSLPLLPLSPALTMTMDGSKARFLRRIFKVPAAFVSRISHKEVRRRCLSIFRFSIFIFRSQLSWLGHILRKPRTDPLRLVTIRPNTDGEPRRPSTYDRVTTAVRGRPNLDWGQDL